MCIPLVVALSIGSAALGVAGQMQAAHATAKAINQQVAAKDTQINHQASAEINDRLRAAPRAASRGASWSPPASLA